MRLSTPAARALASLFLRTCDGCGSREERLFADTWTGKELCVRCLDPIINQVALSPASEADNLAELLGEDCAYR